MYNRTKVRFIYSYDIKVATGFRDHYEPKPYRHKLNPLEVAETGKNS